MASVASPLTQRVHRAAAAAPRTHHRASTGRVVCRAQPPSTPQLASLAALTLHAAVGAGPVLAATEAVGQVGPHVQLVLDADLGRLRPHPPTDAAAAAGKLPLLKSPRRTSHLSLPRRLPSHSPAGG